MGSLTRRLRRKQSLDPRQREKTMAKKTIDLRALERLPTSEANGKPGPLGILLHSTGKEPIVDDHGVQASVTVAAYLQQVIRTPGFADGMSDQLQIAMLLDEAHEAVSEQLAVGDGLLVFDGSLCDRLCEKVGKTQLYQSRALPSLVPLLKAFKAPIDGDLRKKLAAEAAETKHEPEVEQPSN